MGGPTVTLEPAEAAELGYVERLLAANGLPADDVRTKPDCFHVGYRDCEPVGVGGIEPYGPDGLLRSVVIEPSARGDGLGTALCEALEASAAADGVRTLYLLTTTAVEFFGDRGYVEIDREAAPPAIRGTNEFTDLCPASATCMRKALRIG